MCVSTWRMSQCRMSFSHYLAHVLSVCVHMEGRGQLAGAASLSYHVGPGLNSSYRAL